MVRDYGDCDSDARYGVPLGYRACHPQLTHDGDRMIKVCYCQSAKHARAIVKAIRDTGYQAKTDRTGYVYSNAPTGTIAMVLARTPAVISF